MQINARFQLEPYENLLIHKKKGIDKLKIAFHHLYTNYQNILQNHLNDRHFQIILKNKSLALLFLDKVQRQNDPDAALIHDYGYCSTSFASMEIIHYLEPFQNHPLLDDQTQKLLETWIKNEREYLPFACILDGIRAKNRSLIKALKSAKTSRLEEGFTFQISLEEIELLANLIVKRLRHLPPQEIFKFLGGHASHETRILITKKEQNFHLIHLNTGENSPISLISGKFVGGTIAEKKILSVKFWEQFLLAKFQEKDLHWMENFEQEHHLEPLNKTLGIKSTQDSASCAFQCVLADLKYVIVSQREDRNEKLGLMNYKILKGLLTQQTLEEIKEDPQINPTLKEMFKRKFLAKTQYLKLLRADLESIIPEFKKLLFRFSDQDQNSYEKPLKKKGDPYHLLNTYFKMEVQLENYLHSHPENLKIFHEILEDDPQFKSLRKIKNWILPRFFQESKNNLMILQRVIEERLSLKGRIFNFMTHKILRFLKKREENVEFIENFLDYLSAEEHLEEAFKLAQELIALKLIPINTWLTNLWRVRFPFELRQKIACYIEEQNFPLKAEDRELLTKFKEQEEEATPSKLSLIYFHLAKML